MSAQAPFIQPPPARQIHALAAEGITSVTPHRKAKKKLIRRVVKDRSQLYRRSFQGAFLLLNLALGTKFYFWVRQMEAGAGATSLHRPPGVEGWLPIAGLMNLKYWLLSGQVPKVHPAAMFLLITFLSMAFLFRKAFCSWLCPVGTLSEYLWRAGRKLFKRNFPLPRWLDLPLRGLKYLLLGFFVWAISTMSVGGNSRLHAEPVRVDCRRKDVELLPAHRRDRAGGAGCFCRGVRVRLELLVPFPVPLWRAVGTDVMDESREDSPGSPTLH